MCKITRLRNSRFFPSLEMPLTVLCTHESFENPSKDLRQAASHVKQARTCILQIDCKSFALFW